MCADRDEKRLVIGAADTDGGRGSPDLVILFVEAADGAGDGAETALQQREKAALAAVLFTLIAEFVDTHP